MNKLLIFITCLLLTSCVSAPNVDVDTNNDVFLNGAVAAEAELVEIEIIKRVKVKGATFYLNGQAEFNGENVLQIDKITRQGTIP